jgi:hypothetical protein
MASVSLLEIRNGGIKFVMRFLSLDYAYRTPKQWKDNIAECSGGWRI